jgi:GWxTD domain-containing protein
MTRLAAEIGAQNRSGRSARRASDPLNTHAKIGRMPTALPLLAGFLLASGWGIAAGTPQDDSRLRQEEAQRYFDKWLREDVVYVISREEREVFLSLTTDDERERFIEQFWHRRDPDPRTGVNEFREEHYRRIAYANERFTSGEPGWKTDRGRIYITHGPPDQIEPRPSGGPHERPIWQGGGTTVTFPYEVWRYRRIEGVGEDIILEFIDPSYSGQYKLAVDPDEKDAFAKVPTLGLSMDEADGLMTRAQRGTREDTRYALRRDQPFDRYYQYAAVQRPPQIKYRDLQSLINVNISYEELPFEVRLDQFRLSDEKVIVPLTVEVANRDLTFTEDSGRLVANVAVYGLVTSMTNQIVTEFEDDLVNSFAPDDTQAISRGRSLYQKVLVLDRKLRYKAEIVVRDHASGKTSIIRQAIVPRDFRGEEFAASSLVLADLIRPFDQIPTDDPMFVIGDVLVRPTLAKAFSAHRPIGIYFQLYNAAVDSSSLRPDLLFTYELLRDGETVAAISDSGDSIHYFSESRTVVIRTFPTGDLAPGDYQIRIAVRDRIRGAEVSFSDRFRVEG